MPWGGVGAHLHILVRSFPRYIWWQSPWGWEEPWLNRFLGCCFWLPFHSAISSGIFLISWSHLNSKTTSFYGKEIYNVKCFFLPWILHWLTSLGWLHFIWWDGRKVSLSIFCILHFHTPLSLFSSFFLVKNTKTQPFFLKKISFVLLIFIDFFVIGKYVIAVVLN